MSEVTFHPRSDAWQSPKSTPRTYRLIDVKCQFPLPLTWSMAPTAESNCSSQNLGWVHTAPSKPIAATHHRAPRNPPPPSTTDPLVSDSARSRMFIASGMFWRVPECSMVGGAEGAPVSTADFYARPSTDFVLGDQSVHHKDFRQNTRAPSALTTRGEKRS